MQKSGQSLKERTAPGRTWKSAFDGKAFMQAREFLREHVRATREKHFGRTSEAEIDAICDAWMNDESNSRHRYDEMQKVIGSKLKECTILDVSSGCGTFVFYGLLNGYKVYGMEPESWKHEFNRLKAEERCYPKEWMSMFVAAVAEQMPFANDSFDIVSTYQTLEHVQDHKKCFAEFTRILKPGGALFMRFPDYRSTFEPHYRVPMLPLMNRSLMRLYLRFLRKPILGIDTINYITQDRAISVLKDDFEIVDLRLEGPYNKIRNRFGLRSTFLAKLSLILDCLNRAFRREVPVILVGIKRRT